LPFVLIAWIPAFAQPSIEVGITNLSIPNSVCSSPTDVVVAFGNYSLITVTKVTFDWTVNGQPQPAYNWTGAQAGYSTSHSFKLGEIIPHDDDPIIISVSISAPNDGTDPQLDNNTWTITFQPGLNGTYTIGGTDGDFPDIASAALRLRSYGVCGPTTFNIRAGTYEGQLYLERIPGASMDNPVTFQSESHNPETVSISTTFNGAHVWLTENTGFVTLKEISIVGNSSEGLILIEGSAQHINLINNIIRPDDIASSGIYGKPGARNLTIHGNRVEGGANGIVILGNEDSQGILVADNKLVNNTNRGISCRDIADLVIRKNEILSDQVYSDYYIGLEGFYLSNVMISENKIETYETGMHIATGKNNTVVNNFIRIKDDGREAYLESAGLYMDGASNNTMVLHNTITTEDESASSVAIYVSSYSGQLVNNILSNTGGGICLATYNMEANSASHHNNIVGSGTHLISRKTGPSESQLFVGIKEYAAATGFENRSVSVDPEFISSSDLHCQSEKLIGMGGAVQVLADIDGQPRDPLRPTVGADEFGQLVPLDLSVYEGQIELCSPTSQPQIIVRNIGTETVTSFKIKWSVNGQAEKTAMWTGSLIGGEEVSYSISDNYSLNEKQNIQIEVVAPNNATDERQAYNTVDLSFTRYSPVSFGPFSDTLCLGGNTTAMLKPTNTFAYYVWNTGSHASSIDIDRDGYYILSAKDANNCPSFDGIYVTLIKISPALSVFHNNEFCEGETKQVIINTTRKCDDCEYQWFLDNELIANATGNKYNSPLGGSIKASVKIFGCTEMTPVLNLVRHPLPPKPLLTVSATDICVGEKATITAPYGYVNRWWNPASYSGYTVTTDTTGTWVLTVSNGYCEIDSDPVTVTVHSLPDVYLALKGTRTLTNKATICSGERLLITAVVTPVLNTISYTWYKNGTVINGATDNIIYVDAPGKYAVIISTGNCSVAVPDQLEVTQENFPTTPSIQLTGKSSLCPGETAILSVAGEVRGFTFQWYKNGQPINGKTSSTLTATEGGEYQITKSNAYCTVSSPLSVITQLVAPSKPVLKQPEPICRGEFIQLEAPDGFDAYAWSTGETTQTITPVTQGDYSVIVTSGACQSQPSNAIHVVINEMPVTSIVFRDGALFATGGDSYQWFRNGKILEGKTQSSLLPENSGIYHVEATKKNCKAVSQSIQVLITATSVSDPLVDLEIYPNPSQGYLYLELHRAVNEAMSISIYNTLGKEFKPDQIETNENGWLLDINNLSPGIYFLYLRNANYQTPVKFSVR
jgi:hypothetical protein